MKDDLRDLFIGFMVAVSFVVMAVGIVNAAEVDPGMVDYGERVIQDEPDGVVLFEDDAVDC